MSQAITLAKVFTLNSNVCQIKQTRTERRKTAGASRNTNKGQREAALYGTQRVELGR